MMFKLSLIYIIDGAVLLSFLVALNVIRGYRRRRGYPYPPGPPGWPLIGNLLDIRSTSDCLTFTEHSKKYGRAAFIHCWLFLRPGGLAGHIMSYRYLGKDMVILSSVDAIKDLLEKRGNVYSDRAPMPFLDMCVSRICRWYDSADLTRAGWNGTGKYR